jgi:hypothetical protein
MRSALAPLGFARTIYFSVFCILSGCATQSVYQPELGRDEIRGVVRSHFRAVSACYEQAIDARPGAMGKVMAEWDISPDGSSHNISFSEVDPSLEAIKPCLSREIASWKFPPSTAKDETSVKYPFFFDERRPLK